MLVVQPSGRRFALVKPVLLGGAPGCQAQHVGAAAKLLWTMRRDCPALSGVAPSGGTDQRATAYFRVPNRLNGRDCLIRSLN